jgi:HK97 family phage major capsid protein
MIRFVDDGFILNLQRFNGDGINGGGTATLPEEDVAQEAIKQIKAFGDDIVGLKKQQDELNKNYQNLIKSAEEINADKTKLERLKTDIVTREEAVDKIFDAQKKRLDDIEVALKRPGSSVTREEEEKFQKEALNHYVACKAVKGDGGVNWQSVKDHKANVEEYNSYKKAYENYLRLDEKLVDPAEHKTLSVGVDPHGGYTVTPFMSNQILTRIYEMDPIRQLAKSISISTDAVEWLVDRDQADVGWEGETETSSETSTPDFGKKRIPVHQMFAKPTATQQLLEDSAINIESWLANKVAERMGRFEGASFVTGDGIGKPRGFLTYDNGTSWGQIEQVISVAAVGAIAADDFINLKYSLREEYLMIGTFLMNRLSVRDVMLLKNGAGDYIWKPSQIAGDPTSSILELPVRMSTTMPQIATGALSVALASWRDAYMIVDRLGITVQRDPYTRKPFVEFYTRKRVGGDVINYDAIKILTIN